MRHLKGTIEYGLRFSVDCEFKLQGFIDSDWAGNVKDRKSTSWCCFNLGSSVISWFNRKQNSVALSTAKVEYIAACSTCTEAVWLRKLLSGLFDLAMDPTDIWCDNQSYIKLSENPVLHDKSKHIEVRYHYIWDMVEKGAVKLQYLATDEQVADVLTKPLSKVKLEYFREKLGMVPRRRE